MKKLLSVIMSCALLATSCGGAVSCKSAEGVKSSSISVKENNSKKSNSKKHSGFEKFLKITGITGACLVGWKLFKDCVGELEFICTCDFLSKHPEKIDTNLTKIDGVKMERQEGSGWCWNACLTRALFRQGIKDVTQKKVYRAVGGSRWWVSPWKFKRDQGGIFSEDEESVDEKMYGFGFWLRLWGNPVYCDQMKEGIAKLSGGKLVYQNVNLPWEKLKLNNNDRLYSSRVATKFLSRLLNKVRETNKEAILVTLCPFSPSGHAVTIEDVDDKQIIFGEPTSGLMLGMPCDKFFYAQRSCLRDMFPDDSVFYEKGMAVAFVVKKGQEISDEWLSNMIDEVVKEVLGINNRTYMAA